MLRNEHNDTDKKALLQDIINQCAQKKAKKSGGSSGGARTKRKMSGYNCYMKKCAASSNKSFQQCLTEKGWGKLSDSEKDKYNTMATSGCE